MIKHNEILRKLLFYLSLSVHPIAYENYVNELKLNDLILVKISLTHLQDYANKFFDCFILEHIPCCLATLHC